MSEVAAGNAHAQDQDRGNHKPPGAMAPYSDLGSGAQAMQSLGRLPAENASTAALAAMAQPGVSLTPGGATQPGATRQPGGAIALPGGTATQGTATQGTDTQGTVAQPGTVAPPGADTPAGTAGQPSTVTPPGTAGQPVTQQGHQASPHGDMAGQRDGMASEPARYESQAAQFGAYARRLGAQSRQFAASESPPTLRAAAEPVRAVGSLPPRPPAYPSTLPARGETSQVPGGTEPLPARAESLPSRGETLPPRGETLPPRGETLPASRQDGATDTSPLAPAQGSESFVFANAYNSAGASSAPGGDSVVLSAPVPAPVPAQVSAPMDASGQSGAVPAAQPAAVVKGRIDIEDEVVEKVAGLAAVEVAGVSDLGGNLARAFEAVREHVGVGHKRGTQGIRAKIEDQQVWIHVVIVIEYGAIVMEVAKAVKANVARAVGHMLGLRVAEVDVTVDDVAMPRPATSGTVRSYSRGPQSGGYPSDAGPQNAERGGAVARGGREARAIT
ncbi:MAG: Asp23/Gls24 family envelope stress response protein [Micromonosporaceae bacterium]